MKTKISKKRWFFLSGLFLILIGAVGGVYEYMGLFKKLDRTFPADTAFYAEMNLDLSTIQKWQEIFQESQYDFETIFDESFGAQYDLSFSTDVKPWIGAHGGAGVLSNGDIAFAFEIRKRNELNQFLEKFKLPQEKYDIKNYENAEIWTSAYSSKTAFGIRDDWIFIATSTEALKELFGSGEKLTDNAHYQKVRSDIANDTFLFSYVNTVEAQDLFFLEDKWATKRPILDVMAKTLPAMGMGFSLDKKSLSVNAKIISEQPVYDDREVRKSETNMPDLARIVPKNVLFFINGSDLYAKYQHTKTFLSDFHPQFAIIFEGILRGWAKESFGENFEFEEDLLGKMHGDYAVVIDFEDALYPFLDFTLITGFGEADVEQNLNRLNEAIHFAQSQFASKVEAVELPDGTTREELVAVEPEEIPIQKIDFEGLSYYTAQNPVSSKKFTYGFADKYLVFSSHEEGVKSIFKTHSGALSSLAENQDFQESVLFRYSPSESYGFINYSKFNATSELFSEDESALQTQSDQFSAQQFLKENVRNITFSRKVYPGEIYFSSTFFWK